MKIKHLYTYTPPCPRCGSDCTGYYLFLTVCNDEDKYIVQHLKKGEIVRIKEGFKDIDSPNLFCEDCGAEWFGETSTKFLTKDEIIEEMEFRGIDNERIDYVANSKNKSKIEIRKNKRKQRMLNIKKGIGFNTEIKKKNNKNKKSKIVNVEPTNSTNPNINEKKNDNFSQIKNENMNLYEEINLNEYENKINQSTIKH